MYILLLADEDYIQKYDVLGEDNNFTYEHYGTQRYKSFTDFVSRTKSIYSFEAILVDLENTDFTAEDMERGVLLFKQSCSTKLIFVLNFDSTIYKTLVDCDIYHLVNITGDKFEKQLKQCLLDEDEPFKEFISKRNNGAIEKAISRTKPQIHIAKDAQLSIGVMGALGRCGATTIALGIVQYLKCADIWACYVDTSGEHISKFTRVYEHIDSDEEYVVINGVTMVAERQSSYTLNVIDCGGDGNLLSECDIKILCSTSKLWELPSIAKLSQQIPDAHLLFVLTSRDDEERILELWGDNAHFFPYCTSLWSCENSGFFNMFLKPLLEAPYDE